jgi:hypothetical protein
MVTDNELLDTEMPRAWWSWLKYVGWSILLITVLVLVLRAWDSHRMADALESTMGELDRDDPGWRLEEIESSRAHISEEENSACAVVSAAQFLPQQWPSADFPAERFGQVAPNELLSDADFAVLTRELSRATAALELAGRLADMPNGRHRLHYERNPILTSLTDQQTTRRIVSVLVYHAMRLNQKGQTQEAVRICRAACNAARSLGDEPIFITQLIRIAGITLACNALERTLGQGEPSSEDLLAVQELLQNEDRFAELLVAVRGERACLHKVFEGVEQGEVTLDDLTQARSGWLEDTALSLWRMDTRQDHSLALSLMTRRLQELQRPTHEQPALEKQFEQEIRALPRSAVITHLLLPAMTKIGEASRRKHAYLRCMIAGLAAERYRRDRHRWPESLGQLSPRYLDLVPLDPFSGAPILYRRDRQKIIIYSVGNDAVDNGGHLDRERPTQPGVDLGFQFWGVPKRGQPPQVRK